MRAYCYVPSNLSRTVYTPCGFDNMWRSKLFRRFFVILFLLGALVSTLLISFMTGKMEQLVTQQVQQRLKNVANMAAIEARIFLPNPPDDTFRSQLDQLGQTMDVRLRIYDAEKTQVADTLRDNTKFDALLPPAISLLDIEGWDSTSEARQLFGDDLILYKSSINNKKVHLGFVLTSLPRSDYNLELASAQKTIVTVILSTYALTLLFVSLFISRIVSSLSELQKATERLAKGEFNQGVSIETNDEFELLADGFNRMSQQLESRMNRLKEESQEIHNGSERLRTVLGAMIEGVIAVDERQQILFANRAAVNIFEINRNYVDRPLVETIRHPGVLDLVHDVLHNRRLLTVEIEVPRKDIILSVIASRLPGEPTGGVVMVFHDMTELRRLENLRREFVSNVSHELKTPLAAIQAYTDTLLEGGLQDPSINRKFLQRIDEQADRLHMLIVDVIKIAQVESGQDMFDMTAINLAEMVDECIQDHQAVADSKQIQLRTIPATQNGLTVHGDIEGLRTILDNLLDNALKFTLDQGTITIEWTADEKRVWISINDTGLGIPQEHLSRIFERFYRVDKARSREMGGTGLGLSIVKHLSQVFGGSIRVESVQGEGTTFTVELLRA